MENYKIFNVVFTFDGQKLIINGEHQNLKKGTLMACKIFLQSQGKTISKDDLLNKIWKDVIVSDASIFKQVHLVKKLFLQNGLPKDVIENIYGHGYKIKYEIESIEIVDKHFENKIKDKSSIKPIVVTTIIVLLFAVFWLNNNKKKELNDVFSSDQKEEIVKYIINDWKKGFDYLLEELKTNEGKLSVSDEAFLTLNLAKVENQLLKYHDSINHSFHALKLYTKLEDKSQQGKIHLNLAKSFSQFPGNENNQKRLDHINQAITLFNQVEDKEKIFDSQVALAFYYRANKNLDKSLSIFEQALIYAQKQGDKTGQMIAIGNLSVIYRELKDYKKAIELMEQGLDLTLILGEARYIVSAYDNLSRMSLYLYDNEKALEMVQQSLRYQISSNNYGVIVSKLSTLIFLLVQTFHYEKADEMLALTEQYLKDIEKQNNYNFPFIYRGLNEARIGEWKKAESLFNKALIFGEKHALSDSKNFTKAYLALSHYFSNNLLFAIEYAQQVMNDDSSDQKSKAIAALTLAYTYNKMERISLSIEWIEQASQLFNEKWLFEYQLFLKARLSITEGSNPDFVLEIQRKIVAINNKINTLKNKPTVDEDILNKLKEILIKP